MLEAVQKRLDRNPQAMRQRRETAEHPFGTLKMRMGATHFLMKRLPRVATEMALHVLAYNLTRVMNIMGIRPPPDRDASTLPAKRFYTTKTRRRHRRQVCSDAGHSSHAAGLIIQAYGPECTIGPVMSAMSETPKVCSVFRLLAVGCEGRFDCAKQWTL